MADKCVWVLYICEPDREDDVASVFWALSSIVEWIKLQKAEDITQDGKPDSQVWFKAIRYLVLEPHHIIDPDIWLKDIIEVIQLDKHGEIIHPESDSA
jgi:hypothetical protein